MKRIAKFEKVSFEQFKKDWADTFYVTDDIEKPLSTLYSGYQTKIGDTLTFHPYGGKPMEFTIMGIANGKILQKLRG